MLAGKSRTAHQAFLPSTSLLYINSPNNAFIATKNKVWQDFVLHFAPNLSLEVKWEREMDEKGQKMVRLTCVPRSECRAAEGEDQWGPDKAWERTNGKSKNAVVFYWDAARSDRVQYLCKTYAVSIAEDLQG